MVFSQQTQALQRRIQALHASAEDDPQSVVLPKVFDELDYVLERLQALAAQLHQLHEQHLDTCEHFETERQTYRELFDCAPVSYLLTDVSGMICRANQAAAALFGTPEKFLIGRSLALYVPEGERRPFRRAIVEVASREGVQEWHAQMQPWRGPAFDAAFSIAVVRDQRGRPVLLRWMIMAITGKDELLEQTVGDA